MACPGRSRERSILSANTPSRRVMPVRFYSSDRVGHPHPKRTLSPPAVSFRFHLFQLGNGDGLFFGKFRECKRRTAKCVVGIGRRSPIPPDRPFKFRRTKSRQREEETMDLPLRKSFASLWFSRQSHSGGKGE